MSFRDYDYLLRMIWNSANDGVTDYEDDADNELLPRLSGISRMIREFVGEEAWDAFAEKANEEAAERWNAKHGTEAA